MSFLDELKKWTHPYDDEDDDFEEEFEEMPRKETAFEERRRADSRNNKVVNIHATT